jgi:Reverse transcriptase (RNA-dependent DNA polymerase)
MIHAEARVDYHETFAPFAKLKSVRSLVAIAASNQWKIFQDDVPTAFLKGNLHEEIFMEQPEDYSNGNDLDYCQLLKTLYVHLLS